MIERSSFHSRLYFTKVIIKQSAAMSEYQYYEWQTLERPLSAAEQDSGERAFQSH
jgi:hypothetical protein